jgi:predicted lipoprotein
MVGTGGVVLGDAFQNDVECAPSHQAVNESVAAAVLEVVFGEALSKETVDVVGEVEVLSESRTGDRSEVRPAIPSSRSDHPDRVEVLKSV